MISQLASSIANARRISFLKVALVGVALDALATFLTLLLFPRAISYELNRVILLLWQQFHVASTLIYAPIEFFGYAALITLTYESSRKFRSVRPFFLGLTTMVAIGPYLGFLSNVISIIYFSLGIV